MAKPTPLSDDELKALAMSWYRDHIYITGFSNPQPWQLGPTNTPTGNAVMRPDDGKTDTTL